MTRQLGGLFVLLALMGAGTAHGATIEFSDTFSIPLSPGDTTVSLPQFNPALGTLTNVMLTVDATIQADVTAENDSALAGNMSVSLTGLVDVEETGGNIDATASIVFSTPAVPVDPTDGTPDSGPDFVDFGTVGDIDIDTSTIFSPLGPFIGPGSLDYDVDGSGGFAVSGVTDSTLQISSFGASGEVTVKYTYDTVVPEPSSFLLAGITAVAGLVFYRRRRRLVR